MQYTLWDSGYNHSIKVYTNYNPLEKGDDKEVIGIGGIIKPKDICTPVLDLEDDTGKLNYLIFEQL